jgi:phthiocerol/phenolphthiocerol synthesis type-I polyketide synthase E
MPDLSRRIADLSPARRLLFQRLLEGKTIARAGGDDLRSGAKSGVAPVSLRRGEAPKAELVFDGGSSPAEAKAAYRRFYNGVSAQLDSTEYGEFSSFLNYGYVPNHNPQYARVQLPDHYLSKNSVRLVLELVDDCALAGRGVLDVGCGRGGSVSVIHKFFAPRIIVGIDLSSAAISFCRKAHRYAGVTFLEADAEALPFREESFEVVTNVESSHSYPDIEEFYSEVFRVLTSGGYFLYTDVLPVDRMNECTALLRDIGFSIEREQDITTNVLLSCDQIASLRAGAFANERDTQFVKEFLGLPGSEVYEQLRQGKCSYRIFKLRKMERVSRGR